MHQFSMDENKDSSGSQQQQQQQGKSNVQLARRVEAIAPGKLSICLQYQVGRENYIY